MRIPLWALSLAACSPTRSSGELAGRLGTVLVPAGDVDGDGYGDVWSGRPEDGGGAVEVEIFLGRGQ